MINLQITINLIITYKNICLVEALNLIKTSPKEVTLFKI